MKRTRVGDIDGDGVAEVYISYSDTSVGIPDWYFMIDVWRASQGGFELVTSWNEMIYTRSVMWMPT